MSDLKLQYDSIPSFLTVTLAALGNTAKRQAAASNNTTDLFLDVLLGGKIKTGAGAGAGGYVDLYASASADGTTYGGDCSGIDDNYAGEIANLTFLGRITADAASTTFKFGPFSMAAAFGGVLPKHWTLVFDNQTGDALDGTPANQSVHCLGVYQQISS